MKKLFLGLSLAVAGLATTANAQIQKGNWMVGGELAAANFGLNEGGKYDIGITPRAAYFVQDNWAVGPYVSLGVSGAKDTDTNFTYNVGALSRYYFSPADMGGQTLLNHGRFFIEGNVGIGGESRGDNNANGLNLGFGPGYTYFITENIGLDAAVKFDGNVGFGNRGTTSDIGFRLGLNIFLPSSKAMTNIKSEY